MSDVSCVSTGMGFVALTSIVLPIYYYLNHLSTKGMLTVTPLTEQIEEQLFQIMDYLKPRNFTMSLSPAHLALLRWLDRSGPISVSATAQFADVSQSAITQAAQKLETKGYITRTRDQEDQRVVWISLTDEGRLQVEAFKKLQRNRLQAILKPLDEQQQQAFLNILSNVTDALPAKGMPTR